MIKRIFIIVTFTVIVSSVYGQGISFSYLIPTGGYFAAPVSPFSIRGVHLGGNTLGLETGFTLYYIPGLPLDDIPLETDEPLVGPQFAILVPVQVALRLPLGNGGIKFLGGFFGQQHFAGKVLEGKLDRALAKAENYQIVNSDVNVSNKPGFGWIGGLELEFPFNDQININIGCQYLFGSSGSPIEGSYIALDNDSNVINETIDYKDAVTELQGFEISIGASF